MVYIKIAGTTASVNAAVDVSTASNVTTTSNPEQDKYINEIVRLTCTLSNPNHKSTVAATNAPSGDYATLNSSNNAAVTNNTACVSNPQHQQQQQQHVYASYSVTPIVNRRSLFATRIERAVQTIRSNYSNQQTLVASAALVNSPTTATSTTTTTNASTVSSSSPGTSANSHSNGPNPTSCTASSAASAICANSKHTLLIFTLFCFCLMQVEVDCFLPVLCF